MRLTLMDTYAWLQPVKGGSPIAVVNDGGTNNKNAIETDLTALGLGYSEVARSFISTAADLANYKLVIWCPILVAIRSTRLKRPS